MSVCPECGEQYPSFYSPKGSIYVFCDTCGYTNDPERM